MTHPEPQLPLILAAQSGDLVARNKLVEHNMGMIVKAVTSCVGRIRTSEYMADGVCAFIKAAASFDPNRGVKLSTWAYRGVQLAVRTQFWRDRERLKRFPLCMAMDSRSVEPTEPADEPNHAALHAAIERLPDRERQVIRARLAGQVFREISADMGISKQRVSQIVFQAQRRLRWFLSKAAMLMLALNSSAMAQTPTVRVLTEGTPAGVFTSVGENDFAFLRHPDNTYTLNLFPARKVTTVQIRVARQSTAALYCEHLGLKVSFDRAPAPYPSPGSFPGALQAPVVAGTSAASASLLGSLNLERTATVTLGTSDIGLDFPGPFPAGQATVFRIFVATDSSDGGERAQVVRLARAYRQALAVTFTAPDELRRSHGLFAAMLQDTDKPREALGAAWATNPGFGGVITWGPAAAYKGACCEPKMGWHARYGDVPGLCTAFPWQLWSYARPDPAGNGVVDGPFTLAWTDWHRAQGIRTYLDTAAWRILDPSWVPGDAITEGASLRYPCAALVSNAMCGGGFAPPTGGVLPLTLPDGSPEPRSTKPWLTSFPALGRVINDGRVMIEAEANVDLYFAGTYMTPDGRKFTDGLCKFALEYDLWLGPRKMSPCIQSVIDARNSVKWTEQDREWLGPGEWRDRKTGKRYKATTEPVAITEAAP